MSGKSMGQNRVAKCGFLGDLGRYVNLKGIILMDSGIVRASFYTYCAA